jgi:uncharacterized membrane protein YhaH (DUF805 family)
LPRRLSNAFTDWTDALHAVLGFACAMLRSAFWPLSLAMILAFVAYEALEAESRLDSYEDLVELMTGFIVGLILFP